MLFNIILVPMQLIIIYMAVKILREPERFHFETDKVHEATEGLFDTAYIEKYNRKYMLPFLGILYAIVLMMSGATALFPRDTYHNFIVLGFFLWFVVCIGFYLITRISISKRFNGS